MISSRLRWSDGTARWPSRNCAIAPKSNPANGFWSWEPPADLGSALVQAAKYLGARVIAAAGSDERVKAALEFGADEGINYRSQDLTAEARRITGGAGVNVVLDNIGDPATFPKALASLGFQGRLVTAGGHGGGNVPLDVKYLYLNVITIFGNPIDTPENFRLALKVAAEGKAEGADRQGSSSAGSPTCARNRRGALGDRQGRAHAVERMRHQQAFFGRATKPSRLLPRCDIGVGDPACRYSAESDVKITNSHSLPPSPWVLGLESLHGGKSQQALSGRTYTDRAWPC